MKHERFAYTVSSRVTFTAKDMLMLLFAASHHYDDACRGIAHDIAWALERGEDLENPNRSTWIFEDTTAILKQLCATPEREATDAFSFRQLDTMAKAMEFYDMAGDRYGEMHVKSLGQKLREVAGPLLPNLGEVVALKVALRRELTWINEETQRMNPQEAT